MSRNFSGGQGQLYGSLPQYTVTKLPHWQTCRTANYVTKPSVAPFNLKTVVPLDLNYGRSDWYQRGFPGNLHHVDIIDDTTDPRAASFAVDYCPSDYQYVEYADDFADGMRPTDPDVRVWNQRNTL